MRLIGNLVIKKNTFCPLLPIIAHAHSCPFWQSPPPKNGHKWGWPPQVGILQPYLCKYVGYFPICTKSESKQLRGPGVQSRFHFFIVFYIDYRRMAATRNFSRNEKNIVASQSYRMMKSRKYIQLHWIFSYSFWGRVL